MAPVALPSSCPFRNLQTVRELFRSSLSEKSGSMVGSRVGLQGKSLGCKSLKPISGTRLHLLAGKSIDLCKYGGRLTPSRRCHEESQIPLRCLLRCSLECRLASDRSQARSCKVSRLGPALGIKISRESPVDEEAKQLEDDEDDDDLCPVECVREFKSRSEFGEILQHAKEENSLVVVDFFKTACGSCRYIEKGFVRLCKGAGNSQVAVIFLKHNVMDEYEEQSEVAEDLKIRVVPLFHFYKDAKLVESFATREKTKILEAICNHTGMKIEDVVIPRGL